MRLAGCPYEKIRRLSKSFQTVPQSSDLSWRLTPEPARRSGARTLPCPPILRERSLPVAKGKPLADRRNRLRPLQALSCRPWSFRRAGILRQPFAANGNPIETVQTRRRDRTPLPTKMQTTVAPPKSPRICVLASQRDSDSPSVLTYPHQSQCYASLSLHCNSIGQ